VTAGECLVRTYRSTGRSVVISSPLLLGALLILGSYPLARLSVGNWDHFILGVGLSAMELTGNLAVVAGASYLGDAAGPASLLPEGAVALSSGTRLLVGYAGVLGASATMVVIELALLALVLAAAQYGPGGAAISASLLIVVEMALMSALVVLLTTFARRVVVLWVSFVMFVVGHLVPDLPALAGTVPGAMRPLLAALYLVLPNLELFNVKTRAANRLEVGVWPTVSAMLYGLAYTSMLLAAAAASLRVRRGRGPIPGERRAAR
jgi:hypothetical protein